MRDALPSQVYEELTRRIKARDPDLVAAVDEVDWTLLRWSPGLSPLERLRASTQTANTLARLRNAPSRVDLEGQGIGEAHGLSPSRPA